MKYVKTLWVHDRDDEPVVILSEVGADGYEVRKVHRFRGGSLEWADEHRETGRTGMGLIPVLPLDESDDESELLMSEIDAAEFEQAWRLARGEL